MSFSTIYETPLATRYASQEMAYLFSPPQRYTTWRALWIALAKGEKKLGLAITDKQISELEKNKDNLDPEECARLEKELRHDVMAHIHAYGAQCPSAKGIIHLGATSCYVTDNGDLIHMRAGLNLLTQKLASTIDVLASFAHKHASLPCLGYTHLQPAQPTTVGKRACLWLQDLLYDLKDLTLRSENLPFLGVKGATGTQASFLHLFHGDAKKVDQLDLFVAKEMGFEKSLTISSQTYPRKFDQQILNTLATFASSVHKLATDIRLLAHIGEIEEPFLTSQVGSSAMPYKRNPIRSERLCSLARYLISLSNNTAYTAATQWLERTLDDSANRRCTLPEAFLCADGILKELYHLINGLVIYPKVIETNLKRELPFLALENILMEAVKQGKDRQKTHERLCTHALNAKQTYKETGKRIDLLVAIAKDPEIGLASEDLKTPLSIEAFIGCAPSQVERFLREEVTPSLTHSSNQRADIASPIV